MLAALRRLALLIVGCCAVTVVGSALLGLLVGASLDRSVALGFYGVGCFLMVAGFFVGNRGPSRVKSEEGQGAAMPFPFMGGRRLRWASADEQNETINNSAVFISLGLLLVALGAIIDTRHSLL